MALVITKAALALQNSNANFQIVKYESHKPKGKPKKETISESTINQNNNKNTDLKKIRHEIVKFGMQGFHGSKKEEAKIALAVSLGAKPPKREYINYKELIKKRKEQKQREIMEKEAMNAKSTMLSIGKTKKKKINKGNDVGHFLQNYGKVQKKDLKKNEKTFKKHNKK